MKIPGNGAVGRKILTPCVYCKTDLRNHERFVTIESSLSRVMKNGNYCVPCIAHVVRGTEDRLIEIEKRLAKLEGKPVETDDGVPVPSDPEAKDDAGV